MVSWRLWLLSCLLVVLVLCEQYKALTFTNVSDEVGLRLLGEADVAVAAFVDVNADKHLDLLLVYRSAGVGSLSVLLWNGQEFTLPKLSKLPQLGTIVATATADFDGDGWVDVLLVTNSNTSSLQGTVVWGAASGLLSGNSTVVGTWRSMPLVLDANGDHLPDIFAITSNLRRGIWLSKGVSRGFTVLLLNQSRGSLVDEKSTVHAGFVDINSDCLSDLLLCILYSNGSLGIEVWLKNSQTGSFNWTSTLWPEMSNLITSPPTFMDMNGDAMIDVVFLSCGDVVCNDNTTKLSILWQTSSSSRDNVLDCRQGVNWSPTFQMCSYKLNTSLSPDTVSSHRPVLGDVDLDGYPDLLVVSSSSSSSYPLLFLNVPSLSCVGGREMRVQTGLKALLNTTLVMTALYFDLYENGILDILLLVKDTSDSSKMRIEALRQSLSSDHMFLKVTTLSGHCYQNCQSRKEPFGSVLPGCVVAMETTGRNGNTERTVAVSVVGSSALNNPQLPFLLIGLAATPNYIERLMIGVGHNTTRQQSWYREWRLLVPNAQIILVPSPSTSPTHWSFQLYLTTTQQLYSVTGTFLVICIVLLGFILLLHAREKYQDAKQRKEAMHKFHFSAM